MADKMGHVFQRVYICILFIAAYFTLAQNADKSYDRFHEYLAMRSEVALILKLIYA